MWERGNRILHAWVLADNTEHTHIYINIPVHPNCIVIMLLLQRCRLPLQKLPGIGTSNNDGCGGTNVSFGISDISQPRIHDDFYCT